MDGRYLKGGRGKREEKGGRNLQRNLEEGKKRVGEEGAFGLSLRASFLFFSLPFLGETERYLKDGGFNFRRTKPKMGERREGEITPKKKGGKAALSLKQTLKTFLPLSQMIQSRPLVHFLAKKR